MYHIHLIYVKMALQRRLLSTFYLFKGILGILEKPFIGLLCELPEADEVDRILTIRETL